MKLYDKQLNKNLAEKLINPNYLTYRVLKVGFNITLETHHINHVNSKLLLNPNYPEFGIEVRKIRKTIKKHPIFVLDQKININSNIKVFPARFDKQDEDNQVLDETELFINLNINHNLTESDLDKIDVRSPLEHQIQQQEMKDSG